MKRNVRNISVALVGATCFLSGRSAMAALTITENVYPDVSFTNGTYDVVVLQLTAMTGLDATTGDNAGNIQDAEILALFGTFSITGGTGQPEMAMIGATLAKQEHGFLSDAGVAYGGPETIHSSYIALPSDTGATISEVGTSSKTTGNVDSITDAWYVVPTTGNGNAGGIEPGKDPQGLTVADGGSDPYAVPGMIAEILVNPGAVVNFTGNYADYWYDSGDSPTFYLTSPVGNTSNKIISLGTGGAPTGTAPNGYGSAPIATLDVHTGSPASVTFSGVGMTSGYVAVTGENGTSIPELYALQLDLNGQPVSPTNMAILDQIVADITGSNSGVSLVTTVAGSPFAGLFPGYDLLIETSDGSANPYFAFDFSNSSPDFTDSDAALGAVTVTGVAAVPEPESAVGIVVGAAGLLLGRRTSRSRLA